jgi:hypothetical protein
MLAIFLIAALGLPLAAGLLHALVAPCCVQGYIHIGARLGGGYRGNVNPLGSRSPFYLRMLRPKTTQTDLGKEVMARHTMESTESFQSEPYRSFVATFRQARTEAVQVDQLANLIKASRLADQKGGGVTGAVSIRHRPWRHLTQSTSSLRAHRSTKNEELCVTSTLSSIIYRCRWTQVTFRRRKKKPSPSLPLRFRSQARADSARVRAPQRVYAAGGFRTTFNSLSAFYGAWVLRALDESFGCFLPGQFCASKLVNKPLLWNSEKLKMGCAALTPNHPRRAQHLYNKRASRYFFFCFLVLFVFFFSTSRLT